MEVSFAGCSLSLLQAGSRAGVRLFWTASIHTWEQFMREFLHAFENYDYDKLCEEILELRKNEDESLEYFVIIFTHLFYRFPLDDRPSNNDLISCLVSLTNEIDELVDEESKSCFNVPLHDDLDLNENVENTNGLVGLHMSGSFFTMGDIDQIENYFWKNICILPPLHSPFLPCDEKETSCVVNSSSYFFVVDQEEGFPVDNGTLRVTPMVMSGSHYPISSFPSQEMEEEAMGKDLNVDHFVNEENMDTHEMNSSSPMDNLELVPFDLDCPIVINSPSLTDKRSRMFFYC
jgi:hypothetical protein